MNLSHQENKPAFKRSYKMHRIVETDLYHLEFIPNIPSDT